MKEKGVKYHSNEELIKMVHNLLRSYEVNSHFYTDALNNTEINSANKLFLIIDYIIKVNKNIMLQHYMAKYHSNYYIFSCIKHGSVPDKNMINSIYNYQVNRY
jgi:hypothetical protein